MKKFVASNVLQTLESDAKAARALIKKFPKTMREQFNQYFGMPVSTIAEIYTAYKTDSIVVGGEGKDCANGIDTKFATLKRNKHSGGYVAKVGHLKNKTGPLMIIIADNDFPEDHSLFLRVFMIPFKEWSSRVAHKTKPSIEVSLKADKTTSGWYSKFEVKA